MMTKEEIRQKLQFDTKLRGLSKNTQEEYYTKIKQFQNYYDKPVIFSFLNLEMPSSKLNKLINSIHIEMNIGFNK